jgi:hypothetical protein
MAKPNANRRWTVVLILALLLGAGLYPNFADAGYLTAHNGCRQCARQMLKRAMWRFDVFGIKDANVATWDCDLDLYHCVLFGQHHEASCAG